MTTTPTPRCPFCNAAGINQLEPKTVGFFAVIFCRQCGAIHGVVPAPSPPPQPIETPKPVAAPKPEPFDLRKIDVEKAEVKSPKAEPKLTPARAQAMMKHFIEPGSTMYHIIRKDDEP